MAAWAQPTSPWFKRLDANVDGVVDLGEVRQARGVLFDRLDADHDGLVTQDELAAARKPRRSAAAKPAAARPGSRLLARADTDKDGRIAREEYLALAGQVIARRDRNGDGRIGEDEAPPPRVRPPRQP
jgi:Ca2+-binding EF-hand superfamily protein